ncbi:SDR family oxidoreductase [Candidatus Roizmanbacteria bacterium]|nr:SDR family oxidoreductase [Candidatus Roizmanbacteria bacterium]
MKKVALVTGSSQGIGRAIAINLAENGYITYVTYLKNKPKGERVINEITKKGGKAILVKLDVKSEENVKRVFEKIKTEYGQLNVLVSNAGIDIPKTIEIASFKDWQDVVNTKINGNFLCTKYGLPLMKNQDNANLIIIVSSLGEKPDPDYPAYCIGTAGTIAFTKAMALYLGKYNIRTNAIGPGTTKTQMWVDIGENSDEMWKTFEKNNPLGRVSTPEDIANSILMIINDKSRFLNGNIIYIDGGSHLK